MYNYIILTDDLNASYKKIDEIEQSLGSDVERITYDLEDDNIYSVIDELSTISLFDSTKLVICKTFENIVKASNNALDELLKTMNNIESNNALVFLTLKQIDFKDEVISKIKRFSTTIDVKIKNISIPNFIEKKINENNFTIEKEALSLLVSYSNSIAFVENSLDILMTYKMNERVINQTDVRLLIAQPLDDNVYVLVEAVLQNDKKHIMKCYSDLKLMNVAPSYLVGLLINKFQELYNISILLRSKYTQLDIQELFNVTSGRAYYMMKNAKNTTMQNIKQNLKELNKLEFDIKSGYIDQYLGLELYLLK